MTFKECVKCGREWVSRSEFLSDPSLSLLGYQVDFRELEEGLFLFNHDSEDCRTSMAVRAGEFADLYTGPMFTVCMTGSDECGGHCLHVNDIAPCPNECECAYVRSILQIVKEWPKETAAEESYAV